MKNLLQKSKILIVCLIILFQSLHNNLSAQWAQTPVPEQKTNKTVTYLLIAAGALTITALIIVIVKASKKSNNKKVNYGILLQDKDVSIFGKYSVSKFQNNLNQTYKESVCTPKYFKLNNENFSINKSSFSFNLSNKNFLPSSKLNKLSFDNVFADKN